MSESRARALIERELDGALSVSEQVELERLLSRRPGLRAWREGERSRVAAIGRLGRTPSSLELARLTSAVVRAVERETGRPRLALLALRPPRRAWLGLVASATCLLVAVLEIRGGPPGGGASSSARGGAVRSRPPVIAFGLETPGLGPSARGPRARAPVEVQWSEADGPDLPVTVRF
jgi:hypothetical protein